MIPPLKTRKKRIIPQNVVGQTKVRKRKLQMIGPT